MANRDLETLSKEELITLVLATEKKYQESHTHATQLIAQLEAAHQELKTNMRILMHAHRLANVGKSAAEICHEINNPITIVATALELLRGHGEGEAFIRLIHKAELGTKRVKALVTHLRQFVRQEQEDNATEVPLGDIVEEVMFLYKDRLDKAGIELTLVKKADPSIMCQKPNIQSVVQNLLSNAKDAYDDQPAIKERPLRLTISEWGDRAVLSLKDEAGGMDEATRQRVFEDFFTTKDEGQGTGLGLSLTKRLVESMGGSVELRTVAGKGSEFILSFPKVSLETESRSRSEGKGSKYILLVDKHQDFLDLCTIYLEHKGYVTTACGTIAEGLEALKAEKIPFDTLMVDLNPHDQTPLELVQAARQKGLLCIAMVGRQIHKSLQATDSLPFDLVLHKPFDINELPWRFTIAQKNRLKNEKMRA